MNFVDSVRNFLYLAGQGNPLDSILYLFLHGGWIVVVVVFLVGMSWVYLNYIQDRYAASIKWSVLAIDIPQENLQTVKAVEHIFAAMWPFLESVNLKEKYIDGKFQLAITLELVSIGGYTQFLIRVPTTHRDVVEAAFYAQYPKAEIFEVEDYTARYSGLEFPSDEYDLWGSEFGLAKPSPYPLRTYPNFEHGLTQQFADPMASTLEVFNSINKDEELWLQFVITPIKDDWKEEGYKIINKIIGVTQAKKKGIFDYILYPFHYTFTLIQELFIYGIGYEPGAIGEGSLRSEPEGPPNKMLYLTPEERNVIEGITYKISKLGWQTKCRAVYIGKKGKLNKPKGAGALIGALQQYSALDLNAFVPIMKTFTKANYFFVERRIIAKQNRIFRNFKNRSQTYGWGKGFVLNIEELASIFHFPIPEAVRENVKIVAAKKEAPPSDLPDTIFEEEEVVRKMQAEEEELMEADGEELEEFNKRSNRGKSVKTEPPMDLPM